MMIIFVILQIALFPTLAVTFGCISFVIIWQLLLHFVLTDFYFEKFPISTFIVLGYGICSFFLPLLATLFEIKPVTFNLDVPITVFIHSVLCMVIVILSFLIYTQVSVFFKGRSIFKGAFRRLGLYRIPNDQQIWALGIIGFFSMLYSFISGTSIDDDVSSGNRLIMGLLPFSYAPYYLLFKKMYSPKVGRHFKNYYLPLSIYSIGILIMAFMSNHRSTFMKVLMGIAFVYFLGLLMSRFNYKIFSVKNVFVGFVSILLLTGPLTDLGIAMVSVRGEKKNSTAWEMVELTYDKFNDKEALEFTKRILEGKEVSNQFWDEYYVDNIFLARLCNLKFADLSLFHAGKINNREEMVKYFDSIIIALLPQPILDYLDVNVDKNFINMASFGDLLYFTSTGDYYGLESKRQAHLYGAGMSVFGFWYLAVLFLVIFVLFAFVDLMTFRHKGKTLITVPALILLPMLFTLFNYEGLTTYISLIVRGIPQALVMYLLLMTILSRLTKLKLH